MKEGDVSRKIQVALSGEGARVFRNNVGLFETSDGRVIKTGLCKGSSDLIGWTKDGRFLAVEVKSKKGIIKADQANFLRVVKQAGGVAFVARTPDEAVENLQKCTSDQK